MEADGTNVEVPCAMRENWRDITNILAETIGVSAALIMRFEEPYIEVCVASDNTGNPYHIGEKERLDGSGLYCERVIKTQEKLAVLDALSDEVWKDNPDIKRNMISYLGYPLMWPDQKVFGTICVLDSKSDKFTKTADSLIQKFSALIESNLETIYMNQKLGDQNKRLTDYLMELQALRGLVHICANCKSIKDEHDNWLPVEHYLVQHPEVSFSHGLCPKCLHMLYPEHKRHF